MLEVYVIWTQIELKCGNLKIPMPRLFGDGSYSIHHGLQAYVMFMTLHRCNKYTSKMAGGDCCRHNDVTANLPACLYSQCVHVYKKYHLWYHRNHHTAIFLVTFIHWSNYGRGPERDLGIRGTEVGKGICGCIQWRIQGGAPFSLLALNCVYKPPFPV